MKRFPIMAVAIVALALAGTMPAGAQSLNISTGDSKSGSTYSKMFRELSAKCKADGSISLQEQESSGSLENVDRLAANTTNGAIVQTDVLYLQSKSDDKLNRVKTLVSLHPEEVHVIARADAKVGGRCVMGKCIGGDGLQSVEQLAGQKIGAAGGSVVTAKVIQLLGQVGFEIVEMPNSGEAMKQLDAGAVQAVVAVGGAPLGFAEKLGPQHRLLGFGDGTVEKLKSVYVPAKLTYRKMATSSGVRTIATEAVLVVQDYKTPRTVEGLSKLRACVTQNIDELREANGTHPKWKDVDPANRGKWIWYELPTAQAAAPAPAAVQVAPAQKTKR